VGRLYTFKLDIGPSRVGSLTNESFPEPDFGPRKDLYLLVSFFSDDLDIRVRNVAMSLPKVGPSDVVTTELRARRSGKCRLEIVISLHKELDQMCRVELELDAIDDEDRRAGRSAAEAMAALGYTGEPSAAREPETLAQG
jgi:hypothetical protein